MHFNACTQSVSMICKLNGVGNLQCILLAIPTYMDERPKVTITEAKNTMNSWQRGTSPSFSSR